MLRITTSIIFVLFINVAHSVEWNWYEGMTVKSVRAQGLRDVISFITNEPIRNPGNCPNTDHYAIESSLAISKEMLSNLLSASMAGKSIGVNIHSTECSFGRPKVLDVQINT